MSSGDDECNQSDEEPPGAVPDDRRGHRKDNRKVLPVTILTGPAALSGGRIHSKVNGHAKPGPADVSPVSGKSSAISHPAPLHCPSSRLPDRRRVTCNPRTRAFRRQFFPEVTDAQWKDWRWQSQHRIRTLAQFERILTLSDDEREALIRGGTLLPVGVTPYYMSLLDAKDPQQPLRKTVIPTSGEFVRSLGEADDPLGEDGHSPVPGLVHRYPDRVLLLPLDFCSTYCRYCTRSRVVGHGEIVPNEHRLEASLSIPGTNAPGSRRPDLRRRCFGVE